MTSEAHENLLNKCRGISLGIYAGNLSKLDQVRADADSWDCSILHFDVMDGEFVPQMTGGPGFVKAMSGKTLLDVHLMVKNPLRHIKSYVDAGADIISVHAESQNSAEAIKAIGTAAKEANRPIISGLAIMPSTSLKDVEQQLALNPDMILILALDPRTKDPADVTAACARISELKKRYGSAAPIIEFDGGVTLDTIHKIAAVSPELVVSGSAVFKANEPEAAFREMSAAL